LKGGYRDRDMTLEWAKSGMVQKMFHQKFIIFYTLPYYCLALLAPIEDIGSVYPVPDFWE
jgi:hypothetical protein